MDLYLLITLRTQSGLLPNSRCQNYQLMLQMFHNQLEILTLLESGLIYYLKNSLIKETLRKKRVSLFHSCVIATLLMYHLINQASLTLSLLLYMLQLLSVYLHSSKHLMLRKQMQSNGKITKKQKKMKNPISQRGNSSK